MLENVIGSDETHIIMNGCLVHTVYLTKRNALPQHMKSSADQRLLGFLPVPRVVDGN